MKTIKKTQKTAITAIVAVSIIAYFLLSTVNCFAQSPQAFKYQAIARDLTGNVLANQNVSFRISILQTSATGTSVYTETHADTTNDFGLVNLEIGNGTSLDNFTAIDWGADIYFIKIEMDEQGGTNYQFMGTSQLLSVPYALYAEKTGNVNDADADSTNELQTLSVTGNDLTISSGNTVTLTDNVNDADADPTNELQAISISNDTIYLSNGGFVTLPADQTADADADSTNELQAISISNDTIYLVNGGFVILPPDQTADADADSTNELQVLSLSNDTLSISNGNAVILTDNVIDADADSTNELQTLTLSGDTLFIGGGNYVILNFHGLYNASFNCGDPLFDFRDGKTYATVQIGTQCWMAENLNIGTQIAPADTQTNNAIIEKYCHGGVNISSTEGDCSVWGGLYQWDEMMQYDTIEGIQGICPTGWHLPTHDEYTELERAVCTSGTCATDFPYDNTTTGWRGTNEGDKLKTTASCFTCDGSEGSSGFELLLAGIRSTNGLFYQSGTYTYLWSSTENGSNAWSRYLYVSEARVFHNYFSKLFGFSVRCLKD